MAIARLLGASGAEVSGSIAFKGQDLLKVDERTMRGIRGQAITMVFRSR